MLGTKYSGNTSSTAHTWDLSVNTFGKSHNKCVTAGILTSGLTPFFIRSMRTGPRHWQARGHLEITWSFIWTFTKVFFKFPKCFVSRLFQFFFLVLRISNWCLWWYLWVDSASCMTKRFVVMFIATVIMCRYSQPQNEFRGNHNTSENHS